VERSHHQSYRLENRFEHDGSRPARSRYDAIEVGRVFVCRLVVKGGVWTAM
jgi:hypothetical protein